MEDNEILVVPKKRGRPAKQENEEEIIRLYEEGKTLQQIADIYHVSLQLIRYRLKKNNISRRNPGRVPTESLKDTISALSQKVDILTQVLVTIKGCLASCLEALAALDSPIPTTETVPAEANISAPAEKQILERSLQQEISQALESPESDTPTPLLKAKKSRTSSKAISNDEIIRLYEDEKMSCYAIAKQLGISVNTIYSRLKKNNIFLPSRGRKATTEKN